MEPLSRAARLGGEAGLALWLSVLGHAALAGLFWLKQPARIETGQAIVVELIAAADLAGGGEGGPKAEAGPPSEKSRPEPPRSQEPPLVTLPPEMPTPQSPAEIQADSQAPPLPREAVDAEAESLPMIFDKLVDLAATPAAPALFPLPPRKPPPPEPASESQPGKSPPSDAEMAVLAGEATPTLVPTQPPPRTDAVDGEGPTTAPPESRATTAHLAAPIGAALPGTGEGTVGAMPVKGNPKPKYPGRAIRRGWQGRVLLVIEVLATGESGDVSVTKSSGHGILDRAALAAARKWKFRPARRFGVPVAANLKVPIVFNLKKAAGEW